MILMSLDDIRPGMTLGVGVRNREGHMLLGPGTALTAEYIGRLRALGYGAAWIDDEDTRDILGGDPLSEATRAGATSAIREAFDLTGREAERLRSLSVEGLRSRLESRRFQQVFHEAGTVERLLGQVHLLVGEVLDGAVLTGLGSLKSHGSYVYQHSLDVALTAAMIGRLLAWDRETLKTLAIGCILHDVGTIFVDARILDKPAALDPQETAGVREHTVLGYLFLRDSLRLGPLAAHVAYQHHERQDGQGYPRGLRGTNRLVGGPEVHLPGRIMPMAEVAAVADVHDACLSDRPHRRRLPPDRVWHLLREAAGHHLNRSIVEAFLGVLPPYPLGTPVAVTAGRWRGHRGVVARLTVSAMDRPVVRLLHTPQGDRMAPVEVDLQREEGAIAGVLSLYETAPAGAQ